MPTSGTCVIAWRWKGLKLACPPRCDVSINKYPLRQNPDISACKLSPPPPPHFVFFNFCQLQDIQLLKYLNEFEFCSRQHFIFLVSNKMCCSEVSVQVKEGVYLVWAFETAGFHCSVLKQPATVLAFRTQRERQRGGENERPSSGERRSRGGSRMSQTGTQRFLRLNKRQRLSQHSSSDAKTFTEPRMPSSLGLQWQLCHLLAFLKSIHTAGALRERDFYR